MKYLDVLWRHGSPSEPVRLLFEVDESGWELRKLEFFLDPRVGYACAGSESGGTRLSLEPLPPLSEINGQREFDGREVDRAVFESLWQEHVGHAT